MHESFNRGFERMRATYGLVLAWALAHRRFAVGTTGAFVVLSMGLLPFTGRDFFPSTPGRA